MTILIRLILKTCCTCTQTKELSCFGKRASAKDGLYNACRDCVAIKNKARHEKYKEKNIEKMRAYYEKNRESLLVKQREANKRHYQENKAYYNAKLRKYQATKKSRTPSWLTEEEKARMVCYYQLAAMYTRESGEQWHVDHIAPLQGENVSGFHVPWNLRVIRAFDNLSKGNKFV